jgi:hypothetical protein
MGRDTREGAQDEVRGLDLMEHGRLERTGIGQAGTLLIQ